MDNNQGQAQGSTQQQSGTTQNGNVTTLAADGDWHDFQQPVESFLSKTGVEIQPQVGTFGRVRSLDKSDNEIEIVYAADKQQG